VWRNNLAVTQHHTTHLGKTCENTKAKGLEISKLQEKTRRYMTKNAIHSFLSFPELEGELKMKSSNLNSRALGKRGRCLLVS